MIGLGVLILIVICASHVHGSSYNNSGTYKTDDKNQNITEHSTKVTSISKELQNEKQNYPDIDTRFMSEDVLWRSWHNNRKGYTQTEDETKNINKENKLSKKLDNENNGTHVDIEKIEDSIKKSYHIQQQETNTNSGPKLKYDHQFNGTAHMDHALKPYTQNAATDFNFNYCLLFNYYLLFIFLIALYVNN